MTNLKRPTSDIKCLKSIAEYTAVFNIPMYQRLYVWGNLQIKTLIEDLYKAYTEKKELFLGALIAVEKDRRENKAFRVFDLIDGQQRFTTLWLLSTVLKCSMEQFTFLRSGNQNHLRLQFAIRKRVTAYFDKTVNNVSGDKLIAENDNELLSIDYALKLISDCDEIKNLRQANEIEGFANYIMNSVKFVFTLVDRETDLNKLFQVINSRGVQLQHHEILKARILDQLPDDRQNAYGALWDYCAQMDNYIQKNIPKQLREKIISIETDISGCFRKPLTILAELTESKGSNQIRLTIDEILTTVSSEAISDKSDSDSEKVEGILNFPLFLLHVLRIFRFQQKKCDIETLNEKYLLSLFTKYFFEAIEPGCEEQFAATFIELLWELRHQLDRHVIKWITKDESATSDEDEGNNSRFHKIQRIRLASDRTLDLLTDSQKANLEMLQSMLYHSKGRTTMYWLTPFLNHALKTDNEEELFDFLRRIDNSLHHTNEDNLNASYRFLSDVPSQKFEHNISSQLSDGRYNSGLSQYLFYKMEFVLWFKWKNDSSFKTIHRCEGWDRYRIASRNSIEHISPQNPRPDEENKVDIYKHNFGNLALLTVSINSENNNKLFTVKKEEFRAAKSRTFPSLKLDLVFENLKWNDSLCIAHQEEMINLMLEYLDAEENEKNIDQSIDGDTQEKTNASPASVSQAQLVSARYGKKDVWQNVTERLEYLENFGNGLRLTNRLMGGDPLVGVKKDLVAEFLINGKLRSFLIEEKTNIEFNLS